MAELKLNLRQKFLIFFGVLIFITVIGLQTWNYVRALDQVYVNELEEANLIRTFINEKMSDQISVANSLLIPIANSPAVQQFFAERNRDDLYEYLKNSYAQLEENGISQLQFHTPESTSFLRVHDPEKFGDDLSSFRQTVVDANQLREKISGLEEGVAGYGFRVVTPIIYEGNHLGTVEVGTDFGEIFLSSLKNELNGEYYIYSFANDGHDLLVGTSETDPFDVEFTQIEKLQQSEEMVTVYSADEKYNLLLIPFTDYNGEIKGYIKSAIPRDKTISYINSLKLVGSIVSITSLIVTLGITYFLVASISNPIMKVSEAMGKVANGDLTVEKININTQDELGNLARSLNEMLESLRGTLFSVGEASEQVAASSEQLLASSQETSRASEQVSQSAAASAEHIENQLVNVNEITATVEEMVDGINSIRQDSSELLNKSATVTEVVQVGNDNVQDVSLQMNSIHQSFQQLSEIIEQLNVRTSEIDNIVRFITEISEQTNLLALNAAIEAARAGEYGKGFAVVADEVRILAEQSADSTTQITNLITTIQNDIANAVNAMTENTSKVYEGIDKTTNVQKSFEIIESSIVEVNEFTEEVVAAVEQMAAGSENIVNAINNIKKDAEENTTLSHETSAASEEQMAAMEEIASSAEALANLAMQLQEAIRKFEV